MHFGTLIRITTFGFTKFRGKNYLLYIYSHTFDLHPVYSMTLKDNTEGNFNSMYLCKVLFRQTMLVRLLKNRHAEKIIFPKILAGKTTTLPKILQYSECVQPHDIPHISTALISKRLLLISCGDHCWQHSLISRELKTHV